MSSLPESFILKVIVDIWVPSIKKSLIPVAVTVWGMSQFTFVNVSDEVLRAASPVSLIVISITTELAGCESRTILKVSVVPDSSTIVSLFVNVTV